MLVRTLALLSSVACHAYITAAALRRAGPRGQRLSGAAPELMEHLATNTLEVGHILADCK